MSVFLTTKPPRLTPTQQRDRSVAYRKPKRLREQQKPGKTFTYTPHDQLATNEKEVAGYVPPTAFENWF